ncbi:sodium-dependent transporter [Candidatus Aerophobetes bacterium]|uniref:Transporter n=1 Tax=Aerophobetes bacterium TaxID=2030807 RepID=A0A2A4X3M3_UNCAE|nr:MAG: sodium-dependent transporter [Candidatus Aerophobetes bacterium]
MKDPQRETWKSRLGFIWAAVGSAVGFGSIWRFPYILGENGGGSFLVLYLLCLALVGFPILVAEITLGRKVKLAPPSVFYTLGKNKTWRFFGGMSVVTGLLVSCFYAVIGGWVLAYFIKAVFAHLSSYTTQSLAKLAFTSFSQSAYLSIFALAGFLFLCFLILVTGVRSGIERCSKIVMPVLFFVLLLLAIFGICQPGGFKGLSFMFDVNLSKITPVVLLTAMGQAFFSLSLGQGTMLTYGSYLSEKDNIPSTCLPITFFGTIVSILAGMAIFPMVFSANLEPTAGPSLMFQTMPLIFASMPLVGYVVGVLFFLLLLIAGATSQISAMEPLICYLVDKRYLSRKYATVVTTGIVFVVGSIAALSFGALSHITLFGKDIFNLLIYVCINILIPLGGLSAALLMGWKWGIDPALSYLAKNNENFFKIYRFVFPFLKYTIKYLAPASIAIILIDNLL